MSRGLHPESRVTPTGSAGKTIQHGLIGGGIDLACAHHGGPCPRPRNGDPRPAPRYRDPLPAPSYRNPLPAPRYRGPLPSPSGAALLKPLPSPLPRPFGVPRESPKLQFALPGIPPRDFSRPDRYAP